MTTSEQSNDKKAPWDAGLHAAKDQANALQSQVSSSLAAVRATADDQFKQAQELTSVARVTIRQFGTRAFEAARGTVRPIIQVFEQAESHEGTEVRRQIASARVSLNAQLYDAQMKLKETQQVANTQLAPVKETLCDVQKQLVKANDFRRAHPEASTAGLAVIVGAPSFLISGKWIATRNVVLAVGAGVALAQAVDAAEEFLSKRKK
ncbi:TPA: hypothetical protein N0F65_006797 [Lagenidium giganteum]|uniref:Uncharacterized protein n=1 Tax=Lagenidium giganteum TaxID=4803 RepID=A0AAV2ZER1_9STRA|nr:TPA: hypothetical protein N0F65_006797 [Lagenidium giganteum]